MYICTFTYTGMTHVLETSGMVNDSDQVFVLDTRHFLMQVFFFLVCCQLSPSSIKKSPHTYVQIIWHITERHVSTPAIF